MAHTGFKTLQGPGDNAIWKDKIFLSWNLGPSSELTHLNGLVRIHTEDNVAAPQLATNWKYINGTQIKSDDISVVLQ